MTQSGSPGDRLLSASIYAGRKLGALVAFVGFARGSGVCRRLHPGGRHDDDAVVVGDDCVAWLHRRARANNRNIDRAERCLDRTLGGNAFAPDWKAHFGQRLNIAHSCINDEPSGPARQKACRQQITEISIVAFGADRRHDDVARLDLLGNDMHHPISPGCSSTVTAVPETWAPA